MAVAFVVVAGSLGLATVTATAQSGGSSCPSDGADNYSDVTGGTHADDIACLRELGISEAGDTYRPDDDMTRSEMAAFMANAYAELTGMEAPIADHMFGDIAGDPNEDDIARIAGLGITNGVNPEGTLYGPDDVVVRGHMALFLTRLYKAVADSDAPAGTTPFTDIADRSDEEQAAIGQIYALDVTTGTTSTTYSPLNNVTRAQMGSFVARMYRALDALAEAPGAPTGVAAAVSGDAGDALDVSWTAPEEDGGADVTGYVVQWKSGDDDYSADNQRSVDGTSSNFDGLTQGTAYTFRVAAVNDAGQSEWSDDATGTPGTVPGAVSNFTVVVGNVTGTLVLTWEAPADDGGTPITGYVVHWATDRDPATMAQINDGSATSYTITGLKTGVSYRVHIQAVNGAGAGAITAPDDVDQRTVTPSTSIGSGSVRVVLPGATDVPGFRAGGRFAAVTWLTPSLGTGQNLLSFDIQRKCGTESWPATHEDDGTRSDTQAPATPAVAVQSAVRTELLGGAVGADPGSLTNGEECTFRVRANTWLDLATAGNTAGTQDTDETTLVGAWVTGTGTPVGAPGKPGTVVGDNSEETIAPSVDVANESLNVSWAAPMIGDTPAKVNDGGSPITGYKVKWASPATSPIGDVTVSASTTSHTITGLTNGLQYTVTIEAINARGASAPTTGVAAIPNAVPGAPGTVRVSQPPAPAEGQTDNRGNVLIVSWSAPADNGTGAITGYVVDRRTSATTMPQAAAGVWMPLGTPHTGTGTMVNDAIAVGNRGTSYDYRVRATNAAGMGPWSTHASGTAAALPSEVLAANIEVIAGNGSLTLTWSPAAGNGNNVTHYLVRHARNVDGFELWTGQTRVNASDLPTHTIGGLSNGVPYIVGITAVNAVGSSQETPTDGTDRPTFAVGRPGSVTAVPSPMVNTAGDMITVTWSAVSTAVGYQVEYVASTADPSSAWSVLDPTSVTGATVKVVGSDNINTFDATKERKATIGSLAEGTTYVVRVRAVTQGQVGGRPSGPALLGTPGFSAPVKAEGTPATAPTVAPLSQVDKTTNIRVTWTPPADAQTEGVTGYKITWYPTQTTVSGNRGSATVAADAKSYDITGLTAIGQEFTVVVAAVNKIGVGAAAAGVTWTLAQATT